MARYKVLKSIAHNFAHSFVSLMNYHRNDYTMCHLARRAKLTGIRELRINVLERSAGPVELLSPPVLSSVENYCKSFGRLVTTGGAALDMVAEAELKVRIAFGRAIGKGSKQLHARAHGTMTITDDRGRAHIGRVVESYECSPLR